MAAHSFAKGWERRLIGAEVDVRAHLNGALEILHDGQVLAHELLRRNPKPWSMARPAKPSANHPWRQPFAPATAARVMGEPNPAHP